MAITGQLTHALRSASNISPGNEAPRNTNAGLKAPGSQQTMVSRWCAVRPFARLRPPACKSSTRTRRIAPAKPTAKFAPCTAMKGILAAALMPTFVPITDPDLVPGLVGPLSAVLWFATSVQLWITRASAPRATSVVNRVSHSVTTATTARRQSRTAAV